MPTVGERYCKLGLFLSLMLDARLVMANKRAFGTITDTHMAVSSDQYPKRIAYDAGLSLHAKVSEMSAALIGHGLVPNENLMGI